MRQRKGWRRNRWERFSVLWRQEKCQGKNGASLSSSVCLRLNTVSGFTVIIFSQRVTCRLHLITYHMGITEREISQSTVTVLNELIIMPVGFIFGLQYFLTWGVKKRQLHCLWRNYLCCGPFEVASFWHVTLAVWFWPARHILFNNHHKVNRTKHLHSVSYLMSRCILIPCLDTTAHRLG